MDLAVLLIVEFGIEVMSAVLTHFHVALRLHYTTVRHAPVKARFLHSWRGLLLPVGADRIEL